MLNPILFPIRSPANLTLSQSHHLQPSFLHSSAMKTPKLILNLIPITAFSLTLLFFFSKTPLFTRITKPSNPNPNHHHFYIHKHIQIAHSTCKNTLYPQLCVSTVSSIPNLDSKNLSQIIFSTLNHTVDRVHVSRANYTGLRRRFKTLKPYENRAFDDCLSLFNTTGSEIETVIADVLATNTSYITYYNDIRTFLSAAMTNAYTCLDGLAYGNSTLHDIVKDSINEIEQLISNALVLVKEIPGINRTTTSGEVFPEYGAVKGGFPTWLSRKDRRLLQTSANATQYNLVVAKDGSGNYTTIQAAVDAAPNSSTTRFVIYIKAGAYFENVEVISGKPNLMFVGDGIGKTVVKASRNVVDGYTTFQSATVAVVGSNFIAKGITIENAAGPEKHQAVALRSGSDFSAFYQCSFVGYQDTLYVHTLRQFYRECDVYGTIDFIFGNAAVVLQNCNLYARKPSANQKNVFTAQGRDDPNQNTGISILNCKVAAAADLIPVQSSFKNYLGRPWKTYSRTVYLQSKLDDLIDPAGWLEWDGDFALSTLYYGEYNNRGAGSNTSARVKWPGYRVITNSTEASQFTVGPFIQGDSWIPATGVPYFSGLV